MPPASLANSVMRQVVHVAAGGSRLRVHVSNLFGNGPIQIVAAHIAACHAATLDSTIDVSTDTPLVFSGSATVTIPAGSAIVSDVTNFDLEAGSNVSISIAFGATVPSALTGHPGSRTTSYQQVGSSDVSAPNMASAQKTDQCVYCSGCECPPS